MLANALTGSPWRLPRRLPWRLSRLPQSHGRLRLGLVALPAFSHCSRQLSTHTPAVATEPAVRAYTRLDRSLIAITGPDAAKFLNGLVTNKIDQDHDVDGVYAGFLNAQGRILADSFIYPVHHSGLLGGAELEYVVECDKSVKDMLLAMFKTHKLRSRIKVSPIDPSTLSLWSLWDDSESATEFPVHVSNPGLFRPSAGKFFASTDPRAGADGLFGLRLLLPTGTSPTSVLSEAYTQFGAIDNVSSVVYNLRRMLFGVPEGAAEMTPARALPLDYCMDLMGGVDFDKGCYVGQELTIRTHHHGLVRKRVVPVTLSLSPDPQSLEYDSSTLLSESVSSPELNLLQQPIVNISQVPAAATASEAALAPSPFGASAKPRRSRHESAGTLLALHGNVGLALVRLEQFSDPNAQFAIKYKDGTENIYIQGYQPFWWP